MSEGRKKSVWERMLNLVGWKIIPPAKRVPKAVVCVAPHTSNWDFIIGLFYYKAIGGVPHFVMKKEWFFWPIGPILRSLGGYPVNRGKGSSLVDEVVRLFDTHDSFHIGVTPEGTRSYTKRWKTGFYRMADHAGVPIELARIDYGKKEVEIFDIFYPTGNMEEDIRSIQHRYSADMARYPEKFNDITKKEAHE